MQKEKYSVLVIGSGGREVAIVRSLERDAKVERVYCAPGNADIAEENRIKVKPTDAASLKKAIALEKIDFVVIGPEAPLAAGLCDELRALGIKCVGPTRDGARLEASKSFGKELLKEAGAKTARSFVVSSAAEAREVYRREFNFGPAVFKADGLCAGKGVIVARTAAEAIEAIQRIFVNQEFGDEGQTALIEEFLEGREASVMLALDGTAAVWVGDACDFKRRNNNDQGPNTGGMAAHSPSFLNDGQRHEIMDKIVRPLLRVLTRRGVQYQGILYLGLMVNADGIYVLEFNCRFGDPETQVILPRLQSSLFDILLSTTEPGCLQHVTIRHSAEVAVGVVMAAQGYAIEGAKVRTGDQIMALDRARRMGARIFLAGAEFDAEGKIVTSGGRVLCSVGLAKDWKQAVDIAYAGVGEIFFPYSHARTDINYRPEV